MHGNSLERRALEREALRNVIIQWNANRLDLFELSEPNEDLEFHGVMRFYFQDSGQKVATKCIRVASDATVEDVIGTLVEKFRPDMRMLSVPSYALYELHEGCPERKMAPEEKPLLVQLNWHVDDREGRFLLKNVDDKTVNSIGSIDSNASFRRKLSKREKKQLKKQEKLSRMKSENGDINDKQDGVAEKLYTELPETSFTRSISNPEAVMRRRRQQKLEKKLQQFRSKDGGPDTGGTLKIYGEALCKDVPYKTLLLSIRDCAGAVVREMLDKYGLSRADPTQWCLVQVNANANGTTESEYVLDDDECPLSILMNSSNTGSIMFHVRRRPADCAPRKRKKKPGALGANNNPRDSRESQAPLLVELGPDGSTPHPSDTARTIRLNTEVMEVGSANGIALQLYSPHIQPRHCVITNTDGVTSLTPCHADAHTYVNGQRIHQTTILTHGSLVKFGNSNTYRFLDPSQEERTRHSGAMPDSSSRIYDRVSGLDRYPRGQDPILPAVLEFPEEPQEQFLARVITHLDVTTPTFRLAPAYTLYLCARYRASTHYRPELTPMERAHKLTLLLQHAAMLIRHTIQDRSTEITSQAFWLANASELLHFLKSDRHVSAFSIQAQDTLADAVQLAFKNLVACLTDELNGALSFFVTMSGDDHPREVINVLSNAMNLLRKCRVNAALTIQLFSHLFHWISAKGLYHIISNSNLCTRSFGHRMFNRLRNLQAWAESQGLELAAECHLAKILQCAHLLQAPKSTPEDLANLSAACFKLNSMQLGALLMQYKAEPGEKIASPSLLEQAAKAAESVADELARAEGREITLYDDPAPPLQLLLPDDGFSCDVVQGVPPGLADFLHPLQASGLCRLAAQPTSSGHWTVYMNVPRPPSALSSSQPEVQVIRLHKTGGGMGLSIVAAKGAGQERLGIYIKSVVPGGAADRDGRLAAGDQLLSVDGQSLLGITQEKAAEFLVRTGSIVTLEVAKGGAVHHGLATLLQQPSPTPHRGPRRMSERDLPSKVDSERTIPSSKSVPALHHISPNSEQSRPTHDVFNPGYSRTSSNNSINTNSVAQIPQSAPINTSGLRSRSTHNLLQQDNGFYQNLSVYRNKMPNQLGDRTSALRSSQNSLQSSNNSQRPASAYYPPANTNSQSRMNLHQSIPNLKSPPSMHRLLQNEDSRSGSFPNVNHQQFNQNSYQGNPNTSGQNYSPGINNYNTRQEEMNNKYFTYGGNTHTSQTHGNSHLMGNMNNLHQPLNIQANGHRHEERYTNNGSGLLREDVIRHSQGLRHEDMMRYPSVSNIRLSETQMQQNRIQEDFNRLNDLRASKSEDMMKQHHMNNTYHGDIMSYANSSGIKSHESSMKIDSPQLRQSTDMLHHRFNNEQMTHLRGQAKLAEMGEEVRRRQNRAMPPYTQSSHYSNQFHNQNSPSYSNSPNFNVNMMHNTQSMQNLNLNSSNYPLSPTYSNHSGNIPSSPTSYKSPPVSSKIIKKQEDVPEPPPTSTHPLYSASAQDPPKMSFYPTNPTGTTTKTPKDPWAREEQERQAEARREAARIWQEQQIKELLALPHRNPQQEEQLRVLQLEREFQRRALEADQDDEDTEKESLSPHMPQPVSSQTQVTTLQTSTATSRTEAPPTSILKPGGVSTGPPSSSSENSQNSPTESAAPPPPERGSSFAVMSMRAKENTKRVSFNDTSPTSPQAPNTLHFDENIREDPNSFIRQAESMLASPTTPTSPGGVLNSTPGVIGAQEVYKDPRAKRLAEQAQQKNVAATPVPEKLSFKEKMKMFAMESGENSSFKDKSKISKAQREIDTLGTNQNQSGMVH
ncbi:afadin isoform X2 [Coccinella septempunctata]|uniref:afadin isoform X2 n=1 Tax=Coccinella septempunctata TaxID=41139 RepID=UPI001D067998|nr:afadin isoform X2 [Coccinella septempunctata]